MPAGATAVGIPARIVDGGPRAVREETAEQHGLLGLRRHPRRWTTPWRRRSTACSTTRSTPIGAWSDAARCCSSRAGISRRTTSWPTAEQVRPRLPGQNS
ncbi:MAG: hypothetical protein MZW92_29370 [Comamonadaceae bacterium]|nr:hypothetical protein [Comamonadaceae bacterium]